MTALLVAVIIISLAVYFYFLYFKNNAVGSYGAPDDSQVSDTTDSTQANENGAENFNLNISEIIIKKDTGASLIEEKDSNIFIGDRIRFEIVIKNEGSKDAKNIRLLNDPPQKLEDIAVVENQGGLYDPFSKKITWDIDEIKSGQTIKISFSATAGKDFDDREKFTIKISAYYDDKLLSEKTSEGVINGLADYTGTAVKVTDINGGKLWSRDKLKYTILVKNSGKKDGFNITLICSVPIGTGYIEGTAQGSDLTLNTYIGLLQWETGKLKKGEVKEFSFDVFVADYLTFETEIKSNFFLETGGEKIELENPSISTAAIPFHTIVCLGDSHVVISEWPQILTGLLEKQYTHAQFNVISSGVKGEMSTQAIERFDRDVRIYNPDILVIGYGTNDAGEETGLFRGNMDILLRQASSTGAKVFVYGVGFIDTSITKWINKENYTVFNDILKSDLCPKYEAVYIDLYGLFSKDPQNYIKADGMHWTGAGTELAANEIFKTITQYLDSDGKLIQDIK